MKLHLSVLEKIIELPHNDSGMSLRRLLDEVGLEVKDVLTTPSGKPVFTIETLANRGDHLYALGIAREISARTLTKIKYPTTASGLPEKKASLPIRRNTDLCSKYALLDMTVPGAMPIRNDVSVVLEEEEIGKYPAIVHLLNYVQAELGQPMHAFDLDKLEGEIVIEATKESHEIVALDGKSYTIPPESIVIKDRKKIIAVAGVIGCENSMVSESTRRVGIEAALFNPVSVRLTARAMSLSTNASHAFERGIDPDGIPSALKRVIYLAGGSQGAVTTADSAHPLGYSCVESSATEKRKVSFSLAQVREQMNLPRLDETEVTARLKNLGFGVEGSGEKQRTFMLSIPSWRLWDVVTPEDITEEVVRSCGLDRVKQLLPDLDYQAAQLSPPEQFIKETREAILGSGFFEVITSGFYSAADAKILTTLDKKLGDTHVRLKNAMDQGNSQLKPSNVLHLTRVLADNQRRGVNSGKIFEFSRVFSLEQNESKKSSGPLYDYEHDIFSLAQLGRWYKTDWRKGESLEERLFLLKGFLQNLFNACGRVCETGPSADPLLHPGVQASLKSGRTTVGVFGQVNPDITAALDLSEPVIYAELNPYDLIGGLEKKAFIPSEFPLIKRDLTLCLPLKEQAGKIAKALYELKVPHLKHVLVVDDFKRQDEDFRRITFRLTFQGETKTLEHGEVDQGITSILQYLEKEGIRTG